MRTASTENGEGRMLRGFTLIRFGSSKTVALDPAKQDLLTTKEDLERQIDILEYQKAAIAPADYRKQLTALLAGPREGAGAAGRRRREVTRHRPLPHGRGSE